MKKLFFMIPGLGLLLLSGCGKSYQHQIETKAPKTQLQISSSLIASKVSEKNVSDLMAKHPQARVRILSKNTFEFRNLEKKQILKIAPLAIVEPNEFIPIQSKSINKKKLLASAFNENTYTNFSLQPCPKNPFLKVPEINISNTTPGDDFHINQALKLSFKAPSSKNLTAWYLFPPMGSNLNDQFSENKTLSFTPDMPGSYGIALVFKKNDKCNVNFKEITVTLNTPFTSTLSGNDLLNLDLLSEQEFKQISITNAHKAQQLLTGKSKVVAAVLDSGVNYNHPALKSNMWTNTKEISGDGIDNDSNGYIDDVVGFDFENNDGMPMDDFGHGSHVAGLLAGEYMGTGNKPNIQIMALKVGSVNGLDSGSIIQAINYAIDNGANIINMSFGSPRPSLIIENTLKKASDAGILIVAAAGNGSNQTGLGVDNDVTPFFPASYKLDNILSVGASKADGSLTPYSNYGQTHVDIVAIGGHSNIFERTKNLLKSAYLPNPKGLLLTAKRGTSMASPVAAGIAALILSEDPSLNPSDVIQIMKSTGKKSPSLSRVIASEAAVDAKAAILSLQNLL